MEKQKYIAMARGRCPGLWSYYEFFSTLDEDNEKNKGEWKQFSKKEDAVDYLYKNFVPALYMNGCAVDEYPVNKFSIKEKGFESDTFFKGRDGRTWMLDPEGFHIVYSCCVQVENDFGIGIHWGNEIELAMPVSRVNTAESEMTVEIAQLKAIEGALRDGLRLGKNRICLRTDSDKIIEKLNNELQNDVTAFSTSKENYRSGYIPYYRKSYHTSPYDFQWEEIHKLIQHLMSVNIKKVEKTDKNYHRVRKLAQEGRNMVRIHNYRNSNQNHQKRSAR
jgi:ribonuclease HI